MTRLMQFERLKKMLAATAMATLALGGFVPSVAEAQEAAAEPTPLVIEGPQPTTADELLQQVIQGWEVERVEDKERERIFANAREDQRKLLAEAKATEARAEARSQALESEYQQKEVTIAELEEALTQRMGNLGELLGPDRT